MSLSLDVICLRAKIIYMRFNALNLNRPKIYIRNC